MPKIIEITIVYMLSLKHQILMAGDFQSMFANIFFSVQKSATKEIFE